MQNINVFELNENEIGRIGKWYNQSDKGWLYCDDPAYRPSDEATTDKIYYYLIEAKNPCCHDIGFAIVRQGFEYYKENEGFSVGLDIPESDERNNGYGSIAVRKLLLKLKKDRPQINKIYLETLSYNAPMIKIAERIGFKQIKCKDVETKYQRGFEEHIDDISRCLKITTEELLGQKVCALLYELDLTNWSNDEL